MSSNCKLTVVIMCPISKLFDICNFAYRNSGEMISAVLVIIKRLSSRDLVPEQHEPASTSNLHKHIS